MYKDADSRSLRTETTSKYDHLGVSPARCYGSVIPLVNTLSRMGPRYVVVMYLSLFITLPSNPALE